MREEVEHLLGGFQIELGGVVVHRFHLADAPTGADALQHELCVRSLAFEVVAVVRGDQRKLELLG